MKSARTFSLLTLALGAIMLLAGVACGGGGDSKNTPTASASASGSASPSVTESTTATAPPSPTATPTPYNGGVVRFKYQRFGIDAPIDPLSTNAAGELDTPRSGRENTAVAWYDQTLETQGYFIGTKPGWGGNAVFSAHVYYISSAACPSNPRSCPGPFQKLAQAVAGDELSVVMENGSEYTYKVIKKNQYTIANVPMGDVVGGAGKPDGKEWITMITCGGSLDSSGLEYTSRDVVVAERVS